MHELKRVPFQDWCWRKRAFTDDDGHFPLTTVARLLTVQITQVLAWLKSEQLGSLAPFHVEQAYNNPPPKDFYLPLITRTGAIEYP